MPIKTVSRDLRAPAAIIWNLFSDFSNLRWLPVPSEVTTEGEGPGMRRFIRSPGGPVVTEQLKSIDHEARTLTYEIQDNNPLPTISYSSQFTVTGDMTCTVTWVVTYETRDTVEAAESAIEKIYNAMAGWLQDCATTNS